MRIAILTPSTAPAGGVAHALALGEALCRQGHEAVVHAPDPTGAGFFREASCPLVSVAAKPVAGSTVALVGARIADYIAHFSTPAACDFDVFHAQCLISGNALASLMRRRLIPSFVRTVHRLDPVSDPQLQRWQDRAIMDAGRLLSVSRVGARAVATEYGAQADAVGSGADTILYTPEPGPNDATLRERLGLGPGPVFLSLGGLAARKNTLAVIAAFTALRQRIPAAQLVLAGGATSGDDAGYAVRCIAALEREGLAIGPGRPVIRTGPMDQADMPSLYRLADTLVVPSCGLVSGLCVLEAMACGTATIVPAQEPFTEIFAPTDALWVEPGAVDAVAAAMAASLEPGPRARLRIAGRVVARAQSWDACAARHHAAYAALIPGPAPLLPAATGSAAWNTLRVPRSS